MKQIELLNACHAQLNKLEGFEKNFIEDNHARASKFGDQTYLSEKQIKIIERIHKERIVEGKPYTKAEAKAEG